MGRNPGLRESEVFEIIEAHNRPVWTAADIAEKSDVSRPTASKRLKQMADDGELETVQVGNANGYYLAGVEMKPVNPDVDPVEQDLRRAFENRFVGLPSAPWTAVHPNDGPAEGGDKIQIQVQGGPGNWRSFMTRLYENRRRELQHSETDDKEVQALISGELYEKPTVPIEHVDYPDDYDLEGKIGAELKREPPKRALIATGPKNYLIHPVNDAVFLKNVVVDWICPAGSGQELDTHELEVVERGDGNSSDGDADPVETAPTYADIVMLSADCVPRRAYIDEKPVNGGYRVIPADGAGDELGRDYDPTDHFKREVREKTAVDGDLQFERTWLKD